MRAKEFSEGVLSGSKLDAYAESIVTWLSSKRIRASVHPAGMRVWTRGDGTRYRDPMKIVFPDSKTCDAAFKELQSLPNAKLINVSDEFPSLPKRPALKMNGKLLIKGSESIQLGSVSRISNPRSVWKQTDEDLGPEQKKVGQLGPTEKVGKQGAVGKLVGC